MRKLIFMSMMLASSAAFATELTPILGLQVACNADDSRPKTALRLSAEGSAVTAQILGCVSSEFRFAPLGGNMTYTYTIPAGEADLVRIEQSFRDFELVITTEDSEIVAVVPGRIEGSKVLFSVDREALRSGNTTFLRMRSTTRATNRHVVLEDAETSAAFRIR